MAKGHRSKQQTANGPNTKNNKASADKENSIDTHNTQSGKGRNRHREKQKIIVSLNIVAVLDRSLDLVILRFHQILDRVQFL